MRFLVSSLACDYILSVLFGCLILYRKYPYVVIIPIIAALLTLGVSEFILVDNKGIFEPINFKSQTFKPKFHIILGLSRVCKSFVAVYSKKALLMDAAVYK